MSGWTGPTGAATGGGGVRRLPAAARHRLLLLPAAVARSSYDEMARERLEANQR